MFQQLFEKHIMISLSRQMALNDFLGDGNWQVDIPSGTLSIADRGEFAMQVLGTQSDQSNTWLWAWANEQSNLPAPILKTVNRIRAEGETKGIAELTEATFSLDTIDAHQIAIVCTALAGVDCYYVAGYEGGALFTLIDGVPDSVNHVPLERINTVIMEVLNQFAVNHRIACTAYFEQQGLQLTQNGDTLIAERPGQGRLELTFSSQGRLENLSGQLNGAHETAAAKPWWKFW